MYLSNIFLASSGWMTTCSGIFFISGCIKSLWWYIVRDVFLSQILRDEIERHRPLFNTMVATSANHIKGQGSEVKEVKEHFNRVESLWHRIIAGVNELTERSNLWVEFKDKFDSFCVWIERLERKVREVEQKVDNMAEEEGGNLSDKIVLCKVNYFAAFIWDGMGLSEYVLRNLETTVIL